jgi:hypothetical protein
VLGHRVRYICAVLRYRRIDAVRSARQQRGDTYPQLWHRVRTARLLCQESLCRSGNNHQHCHIQDRGRLCDCSFVEVGSKCAPWEDLHDGFAHSRLGRFSVPVMSALDDAWMPQDHQSTAPLPSAISHASISSRPAPSLPLRPVRRSTSVPSTGSIMLTLGSDDSHLPPCPAHAHRPRLARRSHVESPSSPSRAGPRSRSRQWRRVGGGDRQRRCRC